MREPQDPVTNQRPSKRESTTLRFFFAFTSSWTRSLLRSHSHHV